MRSPELAPGDGRDLEGLRDKARTSQIPNDRSRDFHVRMNMANRIEGNFCSLIKGSYKKIQRTGEVLRNCAPEAYYSLTNQCQPNKFNKISYLSIYSKKEIREDLNSPGQFCSMVDSWSRTSTWVAGSPP